MKVTYAMLCQDEFPMWTSARSPCCRIWTPRRGWVQQRRRVYRRAAWKVRNTSISDLNAMVPLSYLKPHRAARWIREKVRLLGRLDGHYVVVVREYDGSILAVGILHDTRPPPSFPVDYHDRRVSGFLQRHPSMPLSTEEIV